MPRRISPNTNDATNLLNALWEEVLAEDENAHRPDEQIDNLINSKRVAIRYCLPIQLLGKLTDHRLDALRMQKGDNKNDSTAWDPREFAKKVIVPWVTENDNVLGTSKDPYVGNPARIPKLSQQPTGVKRSDLPLWEGVYKVVSDVQLQDTEEYTRNRFLQVLRSIKVKLRASQFDFVIAERVSLEQAERIVQAFLSEGSGGDRGLSVAAAWFETIGEMFGIYSHIVRYSINASDASTGSTADIECFKGDDLKLAVEVKERNLTLIDVKDGINKARKKGVSELLFNVSNTDSSDAAQIEELITKTWASGTNLYRVSIDELMHVGLSIAGEQGRHVFLRKIGEQLNAFNTQPNNRLKWKELLEAM